MLKFTVTSQTPLHYVNVSVNSSFV